MTKGAVLNGGHVEGVRLIHRITNQQTLRVAEEYEAIPVQGSMQFLYTADSVRVAKEWKVVMSHM